MNDACAVLGDLRHGHPPRPVNLPTDIGAAEIAHHMLETGARNILVADADDRLPGWLTFDDLLHALLAERRRQVHYLIGPRRGPVLASSGPPEEDFNRHE